jgi:hypothetical protein
MQRYSPDGSPSIAALVWLPSTSSARRPRGLPAPPEIGCGKTALGSGLFRPRAYTFLAMATLDDAGMLQWTMRRRRTDISAEPSACQLNSRFTSGIHVRLLCSPVDGGLQVWVVDQGNCAAFNVAVRDRERAPLDACAVLDGRENGA